MRISTQKDDPGHETWLEASEAGQIVRVYLNGEEIHKCTVADDEAGFVRRYVRDEEGRVQQDPEDPTRVWEEQIEGEVLIKIEPR